MDDSTGPIGVFDSGIGGLSVLRALLRELPHERFVYLADHAHAPYGDAGKNHSFVQQRASAIARHLHAQHYIKALVIACNTATAAAADGLRAQLPQLPVIGVEPALKPAAACTRTGHIGVLATRATLDSARFAQLLHRHGQGLHVHLQACDGLASAIEQGSGPEKTTRTTARVYALCRRYTRALGHFGQAPGHMDTVVLGCTHYAFALPVLRELLGTHIHLLETGAPVARHTRAVLQRYARLAPTPVTPPRVTPDPLLLCTGALPVLRGAAQRWLHIAAPRCVQVFV